MISHLTLPAAPRTLTATLALSLLCLSACGGEAEEGSQADTSRGLDISAANVEVKTGTPSAAATTPNAVPTDTTEAKILLMEALTTMRSLKSYHAEAELQTPAGSARIAGDFGVGKVDFTIFRGDGLRTRHIVVGPEGRASSDDGKTWGPDNQQIGAAMSSVITAPLSSSMALADQGTISMDGTETVDGVRIQRVRVMTPSPTTVWIEETPGMGKVVRKISLLVTSNDGQYDTTIRYSELNKPLEIGLPM